MIRKISTLLLSCSLVFGSVSFSFASSVTPSNLTPYLQSNSGYYWINPNTGYSSTVSSGTKLVDMIGQLGGNLSQGVYNILSKLSNTGRIYLYNYSGTNTSYNAGSSLGDLVGYGFQYLTQTNGLIYDKVDDLLTGVNSIKSYVDGVETGLTSVNTNLTNIKSDTNSIKGYIDGLEQGQSDIVDAVEGFSIPATDLSTVEGYLNTINSNVSLNEGHNNQIYNLLSDEFNSSLPASLVSRISSINGNLGDIRDDLGYSSSVSNLSDDMESIINVGSDIVSSVDNVHDVNSTISAISSNIQTIATSQMAIQSTISAINEGIHNDTTDLNSKLQTLTDNYNNLDWVAYNGYNGLKTDISSDFVTSVSSGLNWYLYFNPYYDVNVYKIHVPLILYATRPYDLKLDFKILNPNGNVYDISDFIISYDFGHSGCDIILNIPLEIYYISSPCIISISSNYALRYTGANGNSYYIDNNKKDYLDISNFNSIRNIYYLFKQAKFMFFDDEAIQAKKDNASQTSAVIDGFTADGDASASASDFGIVKDSVSSVKSGVDTNVSAAEALNIFNNTDGYGFWSTDCLNALDTTNSNRLLRSCGSDTPLYDDKLQALYNAMGVNND